MKKQSTDKIPDWQKKQEQQERRDLLARAAANILHESPHLLAADGMCWFLDDIIERLPTMRFVAALKKLEEAKTNERTALRRALRPSPSHLKPRPRKPRAAAKPAKTVKRATAKRAKPMAAPKAERAPKNLGLLGDLEDMALDLAKSGDVKVGDLMKAIPTATRAQAVGALARLVKRDTLVLSGKGRAAAYTLPNGVGAKATRQLELDEAALS